MSSSDPACRLSSPAAWLPVLQDFLLLDDGGRPLLFSPVPGGLPGSLFTFSAGLSGPSGFACVGEGSKEGEGIFAAAFWAVRARGGRPLGFFSCTGRPAEEVVEGLCILFCSEFPNPLNASSSPLLESLDSPKTSRNFCRLLPITEETCSAASNPGPSPAAPETLRRSEAVTRTRPALLPVPELLLPPGRAGNRHRQLCAILHSLPVCPAIRDTSVGGTLTQQIGRAHV